MTYEEVVNYIESIGRFSIKNSNAHTRMCLDRLGAPDRRLRQIHIAGTNGKGSVCAYLDSILRESGRKTALFTSPHLVRINERLTINGQEISDGEFVRIFMKIQTLCGELEQEGLPTPSYFEMLFLMAEVYFAEQQVDVAIIETGLGGRLDATNAITDPILTIITSISLDHTQYLGDTIPQIASEKAGIIKPNAPILYLSCNPDASRVIQNKAREVGAPSYACVPDESRKRFLMTHLNESGGRFLVTHFEEQAGDEPVPADRSSKSYFKEQASDEPAPADQPSKSIFGELAFNASTETALCSAASHNESASAIPPNEIPEIDFRVRFGYDGEQIFTVRSAAPYQAENAALAVIAMHILKNTDEFLSDITLDQVRRGLARMHWPGRMELIADRVYLDGGHNEDGIREFIKAVQHIMDKVHANASTARITSQDDKPVQQADLDLETDNPAQRVDLDLETDNPAQRVDLDIKIDNPAQQADLDSKIDNPVQQSGSPEKKGAHDAHLLFAVVSDKDHRSMIRTLSEYPWRSCIVTEVIGSRRTDCEAVAACFREYGVKDVRTIKDFEEAYRFAREVQKEDYLFICGSLYLVGDIKRISM